MKYQDEYFYMKYQDEYFQMKYQDEYNKIGFERQEGWPKTHTHLKLSRRINNNIGILNRSSRSNHSNGSIGSLTLRRTELSNQKLNCSKERDQAYHLLSGFLSQDQPSQPIHPHYQRKKIGFQFKSNEKPIANVRVSSKSNKSNTSSTGKPDQRKLRYPIGEAVRNKNYVENIYMLSDMQKDKVNRNRNSQAKDKQKYENQVYNVQADHKRNKAADNNREQMRRYEKLIQTIQKNTHRHQLYNKSPRDELLRSPNRNSVLKSRNLRDNNINSQIRTEKYVLESPRYRQNTNRNCQQQLHARNQMKQPNSRNQMKQPNSRNQMKQPNSRKYQQQPNSRKYQQQPHKFQKESNRNSRRSSNSNNLTNYERAERQLQKGIKKISDKYLQDLYELNSPRKIIHQASERQISYASNQKQRYKPSNNNNRDGDELDRQPYQNYYTQKYIQEDQGAQKYSSGLNSDGSSLPLHSVTSEKVLSLPSNRKLINPNPSSGKNKNVLKKQKSPITKQTVPLNNRKQYSTQNNINNAYYSNNSKNTKVKQGHQELKRDHQAVKQNHQQLAAQCSSLTLKLKNNNQFLINRAQSKQQWLASEASSKQKLIQQRSYLPSNVQNGSFLPVNSKAVDNDLLQDIMQRIILHLQSLNLMADYTKQFKKVYDEVEQWQELIFLSYKKFYIERMKVQNILRKEERIQGNHQTKDTVDGQKSQASSDLKSGSQSGSYHKGNGSANGSTNNKQGSTNNKQHSFNKNDNNHPNNSNDKLEIIENPFILPYSKISKEQLMTFKSSRECSALRYEIQKQNHEIRNALRGLYNLYICKSGDYINMLECDNFSEEIYSKMKDQIKQLSVAKELNTSQIIKVGLLVAYLNGKYVKHFAQVLLHQDTIKSGKKEIVREDSIYHLYYNQFQRAMA